MGERERSLVYRVSIAGQAEFSTALGGIMAQVRKHAADEVSITVAASRAKRKAKTDQAKFEETLLKTTIAIEKARARESVKNAEAAEKAKKKAAETGEKDKTRVASDAAKERARIAKEAAREEERLLKDSVRYLERIERDKTRAVMQEAKNRAREQAQVDRQAQRDAERRQRDIAYDRKRFYRGFLGSASEGAFGAVGLVGGYAMRTAQGIARGVGASEAYDVGDIVRERFAVQAKLRAIGIEQRTAGQSFNFDEMGAGRTLAATSLKTGFGKDRLIEALDVFSEKGKIKEGIGSIERVGVEARAMGVAPEVVAKLRAQAMVSADATGKTLDEKDLQGIIAQLSFIGKSGVFRAGAIAEQSEALFSRMAGSGVDFRQGIAREASFANEARKSSGGGNTARTAINAVQDAIDKKTGKIHAMGVQTQDEFGQRSYIDIVEDVIASAGGDTQKIAKIFDPSKSGKAIRTMLTAYNAAGGGAKGKLAMEALIMKGAAPGMADPNNPFAGGVSPDEVTKDFGLAMGTDNAKMDVAKQRIRQSIEEALVPALQKLADKMPIIVASIEKGVQHITSIIDFVQKNPALSLGTVASVGALGAMGKAGIHYGLRFLGDRMVNTVPRLAGGAAGKLGGGLLGALGGAMGAAGATPVYIVGAAPGVGGFGGGGGGIPGLPGVGGAGGAGGLLGGGALATAGVMAAVAAIGIQVAEAYEKSDGGRWKGATAADMDHYIDAFGETEKKRKSMQGDIENLGVPGQQINTDTGMPYTADETSQKRAIAMKYFPNLVSKIESGEMSPVEAGAAVMGEQGKKGLGFSVGADGSLVSTKGIDPETIAKIVDAFALVAREAEKAGKGLAGVGANASAIKTPPAR